MFSVKGSDGGVIWWSEMWQKHGLAQSADPNSDKAKRTRNDGCLVGGWAWSCRAASQFLDLALAIGFKAVA